MENLFVSVIVPTYNRSDLISETIKSILNQTYKNFELIIVDDGSTDNTEEVIRKFKDSRIKYIKTDNWGGPAKPRNIGIKKAKGEYIAFCDDDDFWLETKLELVTDYIKKVPGVDLICHDEWLETNRVDKKRLTYGPYTTYRDLLFNGNCISTSATVVRRQKILEVGGFSEDMQFNGVEDYDLWLRLAQANCRIEYLHKILGVYRVYGQGITNNIALYNQHSMNLLEAHFQRWQPKTLYYRLLIRRRRAVTLRGGGHSFMKQGNHSETQRYLFMALKQDPFNWKTWVLTLLNTARISI